MNVGHGPVSETVFQGTTNSRGDGIYVFCFVRTEVLWNSHHCGSLVWDRLVVSRLSDEGSRGLSEVYNQLLN